jgi:beta-lactamase regulating signal transducer with metallopeptidase domain
MEANLLRQLTTPAEVLIASIWQGLLLTAFAWAALKLVPRLRPATRFTLWLIVFMVVSLLPCFAVGREFFGARLRMFPASMMGQANFSLHLNIAWAFVIEGLWALASLFSLARLTSSARQMQILSRNSIPVPFQTLSEEMQSIVTRTGVRTSSRPVEVRLSDRVDAPSVIGFFHPAIVMPRSLWNELAPSELQQIVLHEMAHLDRGDDWTNLLQKLLRALCPLNPALFWAERHLCFERERACDDAVLEAAGNARAYATCLTKLAETKLIRRAISLAPGLWKRHSELAGRVESILDRRRRLGPAFSRGLIAAGLLLSVSGVLALQRCPGIITFGASDALAARASARPAASGSGFEPVAYRAAYSERYQARVQEAVFHPTVSAPPLKLASQTVTSTKSGAKALRQARAPMRHYLRLRMVDDQGYTWVLFTVEVPRSAAVFDIDQTQPLAVSTPDNWIVFQI